MLLLNFCIDTQLDMSSGSGSPVNLMPESPGPGVLSPYPSLFESNAHPHLKGDDDESEDRIITTNEKSFEGFDVSDLIEQLRDTDSLHEQADIIHYLYTTKYVIHDKAFNICLFIASTLFQKNCQGTLSQK